MAQVTFREANRRYRRSYWPLIALYGVVCLGGAFLIKATDAPRWLAAVVAILTVAPLAGIFWLVARLLRETDEYTRKIQTEALLTGGAITLTLTGVWSFFELYGVVPEIRFVPPMMMVWPGFFLFYGLAFRIGQLRRGQSISDCEGGPVL